MCFCVHGLPNGIHVREEFLGDICSQKHHFRMMYVVRLCQEAALRHVDIAHVREIVRNAHHVRVIHLHVAGAHLHVAVAFRCHRAGRPHRIAQTLVIFHADQRTLLRLHPCILASDDPEAVHQKHISAQIGDALRHIRVHPRHHAHHHHQRGHRQNHPQQRQKASQFVRAQRFQRQPERFHHRDRSGAEALRPRHHDGRRHRQVRRSAPPIHGSYSQFILALNPIEPSSLPIPRAPRPRSPIEYHVPNSIRSASKPDGGARRLRPLITTSQPARSFLAARKKPSFPATPNVQHAPPSMN